MACTTATPSITGPTINHRPCVRAFIELTTCRYFYESPSAETWSRLRQKVHLEILWGKLLEGDGAQG